MAELWLALLEVVGFVLSQAHAFSAGHNQCFHGRRRHDFLANERKEFADVLFVEHGYIAPLWQEFLDELRHGLTAVGGDNGHDLRELRGTFAQGCFFVGIANDNLVRCFEAASFTHLTPPSNKRG